MFCPNCRAEYRDGFVRCADCEVELIADLPTSDPHDPGLPENERPDQARARYFLAWFVPLMVFAVLQFAAWFWPLLMHSLFFVLFLVSMTLLCNFGGFWMLYQAVRYEKRVGRYVLLAFVPFMFVWYLLVRVPLRKEPQENSQFIRQV